MVFLILTTFGILGNFSLFCHCLFLHFTGCKVRHTDWIIRHLTVANFLAILSKECPTQRRPVGWDNSQCLCVYTSFPCSKSVQRHLPWRHLPPEQLPGHHHQPLELQAGRAYGESSQVHWPLHCPVLDPEHLVNIIFPLCVVHKRVNTNITNPRDYVYCSAVRRDKTTDLIYAALLLFLDVVYLVLMLWASGSMVFILHRHKQRVRHIQRTHVSPRFSPETRGIQSILSWWAPLSFLTPSPPFFKCVWLF